jgi:hypothetical protein
LVVRVSSSSPPPTWRPRRRQLDQVAAHQRLAAGQPDLAHAARDEALGDQRDLLEAEQSRCAAGRSSASDMQ